MIIRSIVKAFHHKRNKEALGDHLFIHLSKDWNELIPFRDRVSVGCSVNECCALIVTGKLYEKRRLIL